MKEDMQTHPSWAVIEIHRQHNSVGLHDTKDEGYSRQLFGSSIEHHETIALVISAAVLNRDLSNDRVFGDKKLIEVEMSTSQFAEAITSLNHGETPCTLKFYNGENMPPPPRVSKRVQFDHEFEQEMKEVTASNNEFLQKINEVLSKPKYGKEDKAEIMKQLDMMLAAISDRVPFIKKQFTEQMDATVLEAKQDFESYVDSKLRKLGLEGFKNELKRDALE